MKFQNNKRDLSLPHRVPINTGLFLRCTYIYAAQHLMGESVYERTLIHYSVRQI